MSTFGRPLFWSLSFLSSLAFMAGVAIAGQVPSPEDVEKTGANDKTSVPQAVTAQVLSVAPQDPLSCEKFHEFLKQVNVQIDDKDLMKSMEDKFCHPQSGAEGDAAAVSMVFLKPKVEEEDPNKPSLSFDLSTKATRGNENYLHIEGSSDFRKKWGERKIMTIHGETTYESDTENFRVVTTADYDYLLTRHYALFAAVSSRHDHDRGIQIDQQEYAGVLYSFLPFSSYDDFYVAVSAGIGDRHDSLTDGSQLNDLVSSYRLKVSKSINENIKIISAIWFQHVLYGTGTNTSGPKFYDLKDHRVVYDVNLLFGKEKGFHLNVGFQDEFWSKPFLGSKKRDIRLSTGIGYTF